MKKTTTNIVVLIGIILTVHLLLALALVGVVLIQRSEGGGLGMGSGGGDGVMSGRAAASALTKLTWIFAIAFIITSITLTVIAANKSSETSVMDRLGVSSNNDTKPDTSMDDIESLLPPTEGASESLVPSSD